MNDKCLIIGHLGLGDLFIINSIVRYYTKKYNIVYILCKKYNLKTIMQMYSDNKHIYPIAIDINENIIPFEHYIFDIFNEDCDIIKLGLHNNNWFTYKSSYNDGDFPNLFFKTFYEQIDLNYNIRYKYEKINRNISSEQLFYTKCMNNYNNNYIFVHLNTENYNTTYNTPYNSNKNLSLFSEEYIKENKNIPIFTPNYNYYLNDIENKYYKCWNNSISYNIIDYCKILENAHEIHVTFSSFFNLCMFINLSNVKKKCLYTNITNIKEFHNNIIDWNIILY